MTNYLNLMNAYVAIGMLKTSNKHYVHNNVYHNTPIPHLY